MSSRYSLLPSPTIKNFIKMGKRRSRIVNLILISVMALVFFVYVPDDNDAVAVEYQEPVRTFRLPGQGNCSMAGAWDGEYYYSIDSNCYSNTVFIYKLTESGAKLFGESKIVDSVDGRPVMISNLVWDPKRKKFWAAHAKSIYLITMDTEAPVNGKPIQGYATATKMFLMERSGSYAIGGMAYDVLDDSLYVVPDSHSRIYQFRADANSDQEALIRTLTPKEERKDLSIVIPSPRVTRMRMSGIAVIGDELLVGVNKSKKIVVLNKSDGVQLSERLIDVGMFGSITCLPNGSGESVGGENIMIKDVYGGYLHTYFLNDIRCSEWP